MNRAIKFYFCHCYAKIMFFFIRRLKLWKLQIYLVIMTPSTFQIRNKSRNVPFKNNSLAAIYVRTSKLSHGSAIYIAS